MGSPRGRSQALCCCMSCPAIMGGGSPLNRCRRFPCHYLASCSTGAGGTTAVSSGEGPAPPSPVPELSWHCILLPALHLPLLCLLFSTSISPFFRLPPVPPSPPHLSWVSVSLPKLIFLILPPSSLTNSLMSLLGWDLPKKLKTPLPCLALALKVPHRVLSLPGQLQLIARSWMLVCLRTVSPNAPRKPLVLLSTHPAQSSAQLMGPRGLWPDSTHDRNTMEGIWNVSPSLSPLALLSPQGTDHPGP